MRKKTKFFISNIKHYQMIKENFYFPLFVQSFFIQKNNIQKIRDNKNKMTFLQRVS